MTNKKQLQKKHIEKTQQQKQIQKIKNTHEKKEPTKQQMNMQKQMASCFFVVFVCFFGGHPLW